MAIQYFDSTMGDQLKASRTANRADYSAVAVSSAGEVQGAKECGEALKAFLGTSKGQSAVIAWRILAEAYVPWALSWNYGLWGIMAIKATVKKYTHAHAKTINEIVTAANNGTLSDFQAAQVCIFLYGLESTIAIGVAFATDNALDVGEVRAVVRQLMPEKLRAVYDACCVE